MSQYVAEGRELLANVVTSEREAAWHRVVLGRFLLRVRVQLPRRGTPTNGWGAFLEAIEMNDMTAARYIELAKASVNLTERDKDKIPSYADLGLDKREGAQPPDDLPPPSDEDEPPEVAAEREQASAPKPNRDGYCTPSPIANALPKKLTIDPCSNARSIVIAKTCYSIEAGQNGLELPWFGLYTGIELAYVNGPFSNLLPFAQKLAHELAAIASREKVGAGFLVNADNSPEWWHLLVEHLNLRLDFDERQEFIPPPGVEPSKNDRPQTLLMDEVFWAACDQRAFLELGTLWIKQPKA